MENLSIHPRSSFPPSKRKKKNTCAPSKGNKPTKAAKRLDARQRAWAVLTDQGKHKDVSAFKRPGSMRSKGK